MDTSKQIGGGDINGETETQRNKERTVTIKSLKPKTCKEKNANLSLSTNEQMGHDNIPATCSTKVFFSLTIFT